MRLLASIVILGCLIGLSTPLIAQQGARTVRGVVVDGATSAPLRFVTVRVEGTTVGTFTSKDGAFLVRCPPSLDSVVLVASMVGYDASRVVLSRTDDTVRIVLHERPLKTAEIVVRPYDPAVAIMKQVLARKRRQADSLRTYTYMLYTKFVAITDTATASRSSGLGDSTVFSILESYSKGYVERPDRYFNEILQRRQTANIPPQANFVAFGTNLNAYDDAITIIGEEIPTPFADDALDIYRYTLESDETDSIVKLTLEPRSALRRGFVGEIFVDTRTWRPLEVRLRPNRAVNLPFDAQLQYRQSFTVVDGWAVMPETMHISSTLTADLLFILSPRLDISIETFCYDYVLQPEIDADVFDQRRVEISSVAETYDSTFWRTNARIPLRPEEEQAYEEIRIALENPDSLLTTTFIDRYIGPVTRTMARLGRRPFTGFEDVFRYNRIHGAYVGMGLRVRPDTAVELVGTIGYGTADQRPYGFLGITYVPDGVQRWAIDANIHHTLQRRDDPFVVRSSLITATSLLFGTDYGDYHYATGWEGGIGHSWGQLRFIRNDVYERPNKVRLFVQDQRQSTARSHDVFSLFDPRVPRENPAIFDASMRSVGAELWLAYNPQRLVARTGLGARFEISDPKLLPTDLTFRRFDVHGRLRTATLPLWTLDVDVRAGYADGDVPPQRFFSLESSVSGLATPGAFRGMRIKEFYGDRYVAVSLAHNFGEVVPGLLRIPNVASLGLEFILLGSAAWTSFAERTRQWTQTDLPSTAATFDGWYAEGGIAVNRILLFFRLDVTARFTQRDRPQFYVTLSAATF
jgi:hypothetical protein